MEPLPRGANFKRSAVLWQVGLAIAGNPDTPYGGNRDMCIVVGSGAGTAFSPYLRLATGSAILAHAVADGGVEMAFVNPSGLLTQAYRGTGLFREPLPVRIVANYPSWDRFVCAVLPRTEIRSLADIKERHYPLRVSIREDPTHSTRVLIDQMLEVAGFTLDDLVSWGGSLQLVGGPGDERRLSAIDAHEVDAIFDEGIRGWLRRALPAGYRPLVLEDSVMAPLQAMGWRRAVLPAAWCSDLQTDHGCIDFSGWPLYTRASLADDVAYDVCAALHAREEWVPWEDSYTDIGQLGRESDATPSDVPFHPGAERWYREHAP